MGRRYCGSRITFTRRRLCAVTVLVWPTSASMARSGGGAATADTFPALEPAPGRELICPCYFEEAEEWCMTSFIYMPYDSAEAAAAGERPVGEKWAPWAR